MAQNKKKAINKPISKQQEAIVREAFQRLMSAQRDVKIVCDMVLAGAGAPPGSLLRDIKNGHAVIETP